VLSASAQSSDAAGTSATTKFKLNYAPHFGMFKNHAGEDLIDQPLEEKSLTPAKSITKTSSSTSRRKISLESSVWNMAYLAQARKAKSNSTMPTARPTLSNPTITSNTNPTTSYEHITHTT